MPPAGKARGSRRPQLLRCIDAIEKRLRQCTRLTVCVPSRSAIVRASFNTQWKPRADSDRRSDASRKSVAPAEFRRATSSMTCPGAAAVRADVRQAEFRIAARLNEPRRRDARRDFRRAFRGLRQHQISGGDGGNFDHEIDAVEQRSRKACRIPREATSDRLPVAAKAGIERTAATAWIHCRDQLETCRIDDPVVGPRHRHFASLERLAQTVEHLRLEFRYHVATAGGCYMIPGLSHRNRRSAAPT